MTRALADARPARTRLLLVTFLGDARKVTPTAGATAPAGETCAHLTKNKKITAYPKNP
jgi:hypothetical protein